ncbi:MAG TPA: CARDB domain-containing protein [Thermoanaerobaculia bacterium]
MKTLQSLALAALALAPASSRAEYPPYSIQATPSGSGPEGTPVRLRPIRTGSGTIASPVCKFEVWPQAAAHGAVWTGGPDPTCAREESVPLPPGRYVLKLGVTWKAGGSDHSGTADSPYEVTSSVNKLALTKCDVTPAGPAAGKSASVTWEVRSGSPVALGPFRVVVVADHATVDSFSVATLAPGASTSRSVSWTPARAVAVALSCEADPENVVGESPALRADNTLRPTVNVVPPGLPRPIVVLGKLTLDKTQWHQEYSVCNVDVDADYDTDLTGCAGCNAGWYGGVPSKAFPGLVKAEGSTAKPPCGAGLPWRAAFSPGPAKGWRNQYEDKTYTLKVSASRDGSRETTSISIQVPRHCGMLSIPICVENEKPSP